ncbi:hypothetical protein Tco_0491331 [Tanacetum coccineum]
MIGSLLYLMASRPDIMFSVCLCAHFQEDPKTSHLKAVKCIFRYVKGTTHLGVWYPKGSGIETIVYADSDHGGDYVDRKSTSGICTFMGCCLTSWFSKKQTALAISTTETEYVSAGKACQQALWTKQALVDYGIRLLKSAQYAVSTKEDTAYQRLDFTRKCVFSLPNTAYPCFPIRHRGCLFHYETPLCKALKDFNYLLKIDTDLFTFDIQGIRTYEEYELNDTVTRDLEEPLLDNGVPYQLCDHICEPYRFKNGMTKWTTCSLDIDGFCNGGELPGMVWVRSMTYFQDHKWYDELVDGKLKEETLMHKAKVKES